MGLVKFDGMRAIGASGNPGLACQAGYTIVLGIKQLGFNLNFAPLADTWSNPSSEVMRDHAFSSAQRLRPKRFRLRSGDSRAADRSIL